MNAEEINDHFFEECQQEFEKCYGVLRNRKIVLFGAGPYGKRMVWNLDNIGMRTNIIAICDTRSVLWGSMLDNEIPICSIEDVLDRENDFVVIITTEYENLVREFLRNYQVKIFEKSYDQYIVEGVLATIYGFGTYHKNTFIEEYGKFFYGKEKGVLPLLEDEESKAIVENRIRFYKTGDLKYIKTMRMTPNQYFDSDYYNHISDKEIFVDCGAYDGDSIKGFIECVGNCYQKIYAFEPDSKNFANLLSMVNENGYRNVESFNLATGEEEGELFFNELGSLGSNISETGTRKVRVVKLDDIIQDKITWLKMDIEGAEMDTLRGSENLIRKYKPKLAVCIYHKCEDLFLIPEYLHKLVPEYKFKVRRHAPFLDETVLYADI